MRWLIKYPITAEEVLKEISKIEYNSNITGIGDVGPVIKNELLEYFNIPEVMADFLSRIKTKHE